MTMGIKISELAVASSIENTDKLVVETSSGTKSTLIREFMRFELFGTIVGSQALKITATGTARFLMFIQSTSSLKFQSYNVQMTHSANYIRAMSNVNHSQVEVEVKAPNLYVKNAGGSGTVYIFIVPLTKTSRENMSSEVIAIEDYPTDLTKIWGQIDYVDITGTTSSTGAIDIKNTLPSNAIAISARCISGGGTTVCLLRQDSNATLLTSTSSGLSPLIATQVTIRLFFMQL